MPSLPAFLAAGVVYVEVNQTDSAVRCGGCNYVDAAPRLVSRTPLAHVKHHRSRFRLVDEEEEPLVS